MLTDRRAQLAEKLQIYESSLDQEPNKDSEERATERENDEVIEGLGMSGMDEIRQIDAALRRIEKGTYGTCLKCGEDIGPERLTIVPHATLCRACIPH
ncbi:TraR/DksA family transcriptional regulator [Rhodobacteraceae bacterium NNCM2]|nr:TraR/DksA family transcriptional regulator [Coraliihabitans acroporae]